MFDIKCESFYILITHELNPSVEPHFSRASPLDGENRLELPLIFIIFK